MWKPGQLVTINHKTYQVRKSKDSFGPCIPCGFIQCDPDVYPCSKCDVSSKDAKIPHGCYLKELQCK